MDHKNICINIIVNSAYVFKRNAIANPWPSLHLYATASVILTAAGESLISHKTHVDKHGGRRPNWSSRAKFQISRSLLQAFDLEVLFEVRCRRSLSFGGDKIVGTSKIPIRELLWAASGITDNSPVRYTRHLSSYKSGKPRGLLYFSYWVLDNMAMLRAPPSEVVEPVASWCPTASAPPWLTEDMAFSRDFKPLDEDFVTADGSFVRRPSPSTPYLHEDEIYCDQTWEERSIQRDG